jgi:hypothetical protein
MTSAEVPSWMSRARCLGRPVGMQFPEATSADRRAGRLSPGQLVSLARCATCEVQPECLEFALTPRTRVVFRSGYDDASLRATPEEFGTWGGLLEGERRGHTPDDVDELLAFSRDRAVREGLVPAGGPWRTT